MNERDLFNAFELVDLSTSKAKPGLEKVESLEQLYSSLCEIKAEIAEHLTQEIYNAKIDLIMAMNILSFESNKHQKIISCRNPTSELPDYAESIKSMKRYDSDLKNRNPAFKKFDEPNNN